MKIVRSEEKCGCVVACLAMVTGRTYENVRRAFHNNFSSYGITLLKAETYLGDLGYSTIYMKTGYYSDVEFSHKLLKPFAPIHILGFQWHVDRTFSHAVVMTKTGRLYCPDNAPQERIRNAYFYADIIGIWPPNK